MDTSSIVARLDLEFATKWVTPIRQQDELIVLATSEIRTSFKGTMSVFGTDGRYIPSEAVRIVAAWRQLGKDHDYDGPVLWNFNTEFALAKHAPAYGPCRDGFRHLRQDTVFNDRPTAGRLEPWFWIPRLLKGSCEKNRADQLALMAETRGQSVLPDHQLAGYGSAALLTALILTHFKVSGERVPFRTRWARTDSRHTGVYSLLVGGFDEKTGLDCGLWDMPNDAFDYIGCFPIGQAFAH